MISTNQTKSNRQGGLIKLTREPHYDADATVVVPEYH